MLCIPPYDDNPPKPPIIDGEHTGCWGITGIVGGINDCGATIEGIAGEHAIKWKKEWRFGKNIVVEINFPLHLMQRKKLNSKVLSTAMSKRFQSVIPKYVWEHL